MLKSEDLRQIRIDSSLLRLLTRNFAINWIVLPIAVTDSRIRIVIPDSHRRARRPCTGFPRSRDWPSD
ncbi:MAG: hypothetical protein ACE361_27245 [Aureliella sp.]